jgi:hypothetical protein
MTRRTAWVLIRTEPHYRSEAFVAGLKACGFHVETVWPREFRPQDVLVLWNRYFEYAQLADKFEKHGGTVLVAENGYLGVDWRGDRWYAISRSHHNGAGTWEVGGPERWDSLGVEIEPERVGKEYVILPQRGIGPVGVAMPNGWECVAADHVVQRTSKPYRVRHHPGNNAQDTLREGLQDARAVVTWGSGAAIRAMLWGVPVFYAMPNWIGAPGATQLAEFPKVRPVDRLECFRRLIWAQWTVREIESGAPFRRLVGG